MFLCHLTPCSNSGLHQRMKTMKEKEKDTRTQRIFFSHVYAQKLFSQVERPTACSTPGTPHTPGAPSRRPPLGAPRPPPQAARWYMLNAIHGSPQGVIMDHALEEGRFRSPCCFCVVSSRYLNLSTRSIPILVPSPPLLHLFLDREEAVALHPLLMSRSFFFSPSF